MVGRPVHGSGRQCRDRVHRGCTRRDRVQKGLLIEIAGALSPAHYDAESGTWSAAGPLAPSEGLRQGGPQIALSPGGRGVAAWVDGDLETSAI